MIIETTINLKNKSKEELILLLNESLGVIKKLQKENEELKEIYRSEKKMKNEYIKLYQDLLLKENIIPIQKIKDKIKKIDQKIKYEENEKVVIYLHKQKNILQELLESEE